MAHDRVERSLMDDPVSVLIPRAPYTLHINATVADAVEMLLKHNIGAVLIVDVDDQLAGIFSERDLLMKVAGKYESYKTAYLRDYMTRELVTVRENDSLAFALHKMSVGGYRHLPVVQEGKLVGMVSVRDMLGHITRLCEKPPTGGPSDG
jgi:CBS domain-containing protein